jgi:hypothetical protein
LTIRNSGLVLDALQASPDKRREPAIISQSIRGAPLFLVCVTRAGRATSSVYLPPLTAWRKVLGSPEVTPAVHDRLAAGLHEEVAPRNRELEAQRDKILLSLVELRKKGETGRDRFERCASMRAHRNAEGSCGPRGQTPNHAVFKKIFHSVVARRSCPKKYHPFVGCVADTG